MTVVTTPSAVAKVEEFLRPVLPTRGVEPTTVHSGSFSDWVAIFPRLAWSALREDEVIDFVTWSVLRQHVARRHRGAGALAAEDAAGAIRDWRPDIDPRSVRRLIQRGGERGYWVRASLGGAPHIWLASAGRLLVRFDLESSGIPQFVRLASMRLPAQMRAVLYATTRLLPGHSGAFTGGLISRKTIEHLTGLTPRTQQRYDNDYNATELVQECHALVEGHEGPLLFGEGYYFDRFGRQWKRLPDLRTPAAHMRGSKSASANANRRANKLRARWRNSGTPEDTACIVSPAGNGLPAAPEFRQRTYFIAAREELGRKQLRAQCGYCVNRRSGTCPHIQGVVGFGEPGRMQFIISG